MNTMKRAWEIAKEAVVKFGGKTKEYFAEALKLAWKEVKAAAMKSEISFTLYAKQNGFLFFSTKNAENLKVSFLTEEKSVLTGKTHIARNDMTGKFRLVKQGETGEVLRLYQPALGCGDIEITLNGQVEVITNHIDKKWLKTRG